MNLIEFDGLKLDSFLNKNKKIIQKMFKILKDNDVIKYLEYDFNKLYTYISESSSIKSLSKDSRPASSSLITAILLKSAIDFLPYLTEIPEDCFHELPITKIEIPDNIKAIGDSAFYDCNHLTSVTMPDSVTHIGEFAFSDCTSLTNIKIPDNVTSIEYYAFSDCTSLTSVKIPDTITIIREAAFRRCTSLTSITIPGNVTTIGDNVFHDCASLTSVTIGNGITSIGYAAFCDCNHLTSVTISDSVTNIDSNAFADCKKLKEIKYLGTKEQWKKVRKSTVPAVIKQIVCSDGVINNW